MVQFAESSYVFSRNIAARFFLKLISAFFRAKIVRLSVKLARIFRFRFFDHHVAHGVACQIFYFAHKDLPARVNVQHGGHGNDAPLGTNAG